MGWKQFGRLAACGLTVLALTPLVWAAGEDQIEGLVKWPKVTITGIKDGKVLFLNVNGEQKTADLSTIKKLVIKDQPQFTQAEEQFANGQWAPAARSYEDAVKRFSSPQTAGFRDYSFEKAMKAYVKAKAFDKMLEVYGAYHNLNATGAENALPAEKPAASSPEMAAAIKVLESKWAGAKANADRQFWGNLLVSYYTENQMADKANPIIEALGKIADKAPTPAPAGAGTGTGTETSGTSGGKTTALTTQAGTLLIQKLEIAAGQGQWDAILTELDAKSEQAGERQLADLQYFRGLAQFNKGEFAKAGVNFMWVWACIPGKNPRRFWSLYYTGQVYEKLNKAPNAKDIYKELLDKYGRDLPPNLKPEVEKSLKAIGG